LGDEGEAEADAHCVGVRTVGGTLRPWIGTDALCVALATLCGHVQRRDQGGGGEGDDGDAWATNLTTADRARRLWNQSAATAWGTLHFEATAVEEHMRLVGDRLADAVGSCEALGAEFARLSRDHDHLQRRQSEGVGSLSLLAKRLRHLDLSQSLNRLRSAQEDMARHLEDEASVRARHIKVLRNAEATLVGVVNATTPTEARGNEVSRVASLVEACVLRELCAGDLEFILNFRAEQQRSKRLRERLRQQRSQPGGL